MGEPWLGGRDCRSWEYPGREQGLWIMGEPWLGGRDSRSWENPGWGAGNVDHGRTLAGGYGL